DRIERNIEHCFVSVNGLARLPSLGVAPRDLNSPSRAATVVGTELRRQKMAFAMVTCAIEYPQGPQSCEAGKGFLLERVVNVGVPAEDLARPFGRQDDDDGATWRRNCHDLAVAAAQPGVIAPWSIDEEPRVEQAQAWSVGELGSCHSRLPDNLRTRACGERRAAAAGANVRAGDALLFKQSHGASVPCEHVLRSRPRPTSGRRLPGRPTRPERAGIRCP